MDLRFRLRIATEIFVSHPDTIEFLQTLENCSGKNRTLFERNHAIRDRHLKFGANRVCLQAPRTLVPHRQNP